MKILRRIKIFIFLIGVLIVPLFFSTSVSAETTATKVGWYSRSVTYEDTGGTPRYKYTGSIVILTNDENAYGTITVSGTEYHYSSKYTEIPINGTTGSINSIPSSVSGTFTPGDSGLDVVQLNPVQLQALLDVIRDNAGSDLSNIETTLDLINTTLISINVNTENNEGESYLRLINELLDEQLPLYKTILTNIQNNTSNIYTQLSNIRSQLASIVIYTNQLNNKFPSSYGNSVLTKLDTLNITCNAIITAIDTDFQHLEENIDNIIDNVTWNDLAFNIQYRDSNNEWQDITNGAYLSSNTTFRIYIDPTTFNKMDTSNIYKINTGLINAWGGTTITNVKVYSTADPNGDYTHVYYNYGGNVLTIYLYDTRMYRDTYSGGAYVYYSVYTNNPIDTNRLRIINIPNMQYINASDIEYWELLYYMKSFQFYKDMTTEIETTNNLGNINSQLQQNSQQMFNQEEEFNNNLNSYLGAITLPDNPFNNFGTMFGQSSRFLVYMFDQMTTTRGSPFGTVITFSLLLGLALLMIGKKGR